MDLSTLAPESRKVHVRHPVTNAPTGLVVTMLPQSAPAVQAVRRRWLNSRLGRNRKVTAEQIESHSVDQLCAAVTGWEWGGDSSYKGAKPEFNEDMLRQVLKACEWMRAQLDEELGDDAAFFRGSDGESG